MKYSNIVFLISSKTSIGVLESQVLKFANHIAINYDFKVKVVLCGDEIFFDKNSYSNKLEFHYLNKTIFIQEIKKCKVYIRTIDIFLKKYLQLKIQKNYLIYDFRALLFVESFSRRRNYLVSTLIFMLEMTTYLLANQVCCVSENLKNSLLKFFRLYKNIHVFPCLVSGSKLTKKSTRSSESMDYNFVYLGSISEWQKFDKAVNLYKDYSKNNNSSFTVITNDKQKALQILKKKGVVGKILSLNNNEVLNELKKYDFGFLLRDVNLLNYVASPIKYLEYLACGVIPIMNIGIGDYSKDALSNNIAIVLKNNKKLIKSDLSKLFNDTSYFSRVNNYYKSFDYDENVKRHPLIN